MTENNLTTQNDIVTEKIVQDNENFTVVQLPNGKFRKDMKYKRYYSNIPTDDAEMLELYKILNTEDNEAVTPMKNTIGKEIEIHHAFTNPYQSFDENTGGNTNGVTTTIFTGTEYIATSSKSVYYAILGLFDTFGYPDKEGYKPIKVKVTSRKMPNGEQINLELISI